MRLYVENDEHEWTDRPDSDAFCLRSMEPDPNG